MAVFPRFADGRGASRSGSKTDDRRSRGVDATKVNENYFKTPYYRIFSAFCDVFSGLGKLYLLSREIRR